jgi:hypothetical protein
MTSIGAQVGHVQGLLAHVMEALVSPSSLKWIMKYVDWKSSVLACTMTIILAVIADERYF